MVTVKFEITSEDGTSKSCDISGTPEVLNQLFTLPHWKLPHTSGKTEPHLVGVFFDIFEKFIKEHGPAFSTEFEAKKEKFRKTLEDEGAVCHSLTKEVLLKGEFSITRSIRLGPWKFTLSMSESLTGYALTLKSVESKTNQKTLRTFVPQITQKSLERDFNKNRATAGFKKLELLSKSLTGHSLKRER